MPSIHFESVADMCAHALAHRHQGGARHCLDQSRSFLGLDATDDTSPEGLQARAIYGTPAATAQIVAMLGQVRAAAATDTRMHTVRADTGRIDVWAAMRGDALCCTKRKRGNVRAPKIVRLTVPTVTSWRQAASVSRWRAVCAIVAADALTAAGYSVEIVSICNALDHHKSRAPLIVTCAIKAASQPLDVAAVAGALLPSTTRALVYAIHKTLCRNPESTESTHGATIDQDDPLTVRACYGQDQPHERGDQNAVLAEAQRLIDAVAL